MYAIFASTGAGVVLPGTLLSVLLARWSLSDQQAGVLFFFFFVGSSCGALLARGRLTRSIGRGCICIAIGCGALAASAHLVTFCAMTLVGFGLGLTMTSVSLLQSRRHAEARTAEMARLNMIWAFGAFLSPAILLRSVVHWSVSVVLVVVAVWFVVLGMLAFLMQIDVAAPPTTFSSGFRGVRVIPFALLALVPLATGIESSVGGWLEAYARRSGLMMSTTISVVTCFWAGLLLSRLFQSRRKFADRMQAIVLRISPWAMSLALITIIVRPQGWYILLAASLLGMAIGPIYPLVLSMLLGFGEAGNVMFLAGGIGASALPLLTGLVSGWSKSLATGLSVPLAGSFAMAIFGLAYRRSERATK